MSGINLPDQVACRLAAGVAYRAGHLVCGGMFGIHLPVFPDRRQWSLVHVPSGCQLCCSTDGERLLWIAEELASRWPECWQLAEPWRHPDYDKVNCLLVARLGLRDDRDADRCRLREGE